MSNLIRAPTRPAKPQSADKTSLTAKQRLNYLSQNRIDVRSTNEMERQLMKEKVRLKKDRLLAQESDGV